MSAVLRYITKDGDRWDLLAHKHYGNALLIGLIDGITLNLAIDAHQIAFVQ